MSGLPLSNVETKAPTPKSADDVLDLFKSDDSKDDKTPPVKEEEEKPKKEAKKEKESSEEEDEEIKIEDRDEEEDEKLDLKEDKEEDQEEDEELEIQTPPRKKEITAAFPGFFEKFPWMEKMMFRDKQYTELFGSFDDAREVKASADILSSFEQDLIKGDSTPVLKQMKENAPESFSKLVDNYLPNLYKVDQEAYYHIIGNVTKSIIREMKGKDPDGAKALAQFMFNADEAGDPKNLSQPEKKEDEGLKKDREDFVRERYEAARSDLQTKVDNVLRSTINDYIDPKNEMSPYVKKNAVKDALASLHEQIGSDTQFGKSLTKLWENAFRDKFSENSKTSIRSAYLGKAKTLLKVVISKARAEALKGAVPAKRKEEDEDDEKETRQRKTTAAPRRNSGNPRERQRGESVADFFARD